MRTNGTHTPRTHVLRWLVVAALIAPATVGAAESGSTTGASAQDCELGGRYLELAAKATAEFRQDDAYQFMERASEVCASYQTWMQLGELAAAFGEEARTARAAEAFVAAYELGATPAEQAVAVGRYAELLFHSDDPQKALTYVQQARGLDPDNPWVAELATRINERAANLTPEDIKRGLGDIAFKPLRLQRTPEPGERPSGGSGGASAAAVAPSPERRAINIPLNFELNSVALDQWTRKNISVLAQTLVDPEYANRRFLLIGHADVRGSANDNMLLSVERANAIAAEIGQLQPALKDRLRTAGEGEQRPLSQGDTEEDHRVNRRLEVVLE